MIYLSIAICFVAAIARDALRVWLKHRANVERIDKRMEALEVALGGVQDRNDKAIGLLAVDFKKKLKEIEASNEALKKHIDGQVVGTIAQLPNTGGGFNRGVR